MKQALKAAERSALGSKGGNVLCERGFVYSYDKGGERSQLSDSGYHIFDFKGLASSIGRGKGMLEDGFISAEVRNQWSTWHTPVVYLDLGTEQSLKAARDTLRTDAEVLYAKQDREIRAKSALRILRNKLGSMAQI